MLLRIWKWGRGRCQCKKHIRCTQALKPLKEYNNKNKYNNGKHSLVSHFYFTICVRYNLFSFLCRVLWGSWLLWINPGFCCNCKCVTLSRTHSPVPVSAGSDGGWRVLVSSAGSPALWHVAALSVASWCSPRRPWEWCPCSSAYPWGVDG